MAKKEPKGQTKTLGPTSVIGNQNSQIWLKRANLATLMLQLAE